MIKKVFITFFLFFLAFSAFPSKIISPVEGSFSNLQSLIIDLDSDAEAFYSYTNTNPLNSGFAYDGPVLIDKSGQVELYIVVVSSKGQESFSVKYSVSQENPYPKDSAEEKFISSIINENILSCSSENVIQVPSTFNLFVGDGESPFNKGGILSLAKDNNLARYLPCIVCDPSSSLSWRFIVHFSPQNKGLLSKASLPFTIKDWTQFSFTGKNLIWSIDDGQWSASKESITLDRSRAHTVRWQSVAFQKGNSIESFELPPKPTVTQSYRDMAVIFSIDGDLSYTMEVISSGSDGDSGEKTGLLQKILFDTLAGDYIKAQATFALYCRGLYQGNISSAYIIDRRPPLPPKFLPSESGFYVRHDVKLSVQAEENAKIFLNVTGPYPIDSNSYLVSDEDFSFIHPQDYIQCDSPLFTLRSGGNKSVYYKAFAYAQDSAGNTSDISTYSVIIDEFNYYIDASSNSKISDGSHLNPFKNFEDAIQVINSGRFVHFFINGSITLPEKELLISSNSAFTGTNDARLLLPATSFIRLENSSLQIQNCVIEKNSVDEDLSEEKIFIMENSTVSFEDCEIYGNFSSSGTGIISRGSFLIFKNSGLTLQGRTYVCGISAIKSGLSLNGGHFSSIAQTAVNFSLDGGSLELKKSDCKVISHLGRIIESSGAHLKLRENSYTGEFDSEKSSLVPVWKDETSLLLEDRDNKITGFNIN